MKLVILLLSISTLSLAQSQSQPVTQYFSAAGGGFNRANAPQINGWISAGVKVTGNLYSYTTTEYTAVNSTVRTGLARVMFQQDGLTLMTLVDAGMATSERSIVGSFSLGGIVAYDISKLGFKIPNTHVMFSVRPIKTNSADANGGGINLAFQFGFAKTF